ncbi:bcl-2 homologous antagonist/killer isoform X3 [Peromyscus californicus insignis]|uniref:bcl-2 homologous antagonist/killer isoform X3 n=1 Tax=Peromyscus californicus insignis TaxID=564181 RepID=UPI0022A7B0F6|nr:bcl-2 homologous antagonist/killer isoform X3 [Peromyscus californicus insignis]
MASGQGPGPPREDCDDSPSPSAPTSEQQVAQDTEEVFRSYVFHLHHREQETQGAAAPANPEMDNLLLEPNNVLGQVGRQLAIIGDDINRRYDTEFQNLLEQLQPTAGNAYELFTKIASSPGCPGTRSVAQAGLKLTEICLPLPPECWDYRRDPPPPILCVWVVSLHLRMCACMPDAKQARRRPLELESQTAVNHHGGAGN